MNHTGEKKSSLPAMNKKGKQTSIQSAKSDTIPKIEKYSKRYAGQHAETVEFVKHMTNVNLNDYRIWDGAYATTNFDNKTYKVAVDWKYMPKTVQQEIRYIEAKGMIKTENLGAWMKYIYLPKHMKK